MLGKNGLHQQAVTSGSQQLGSGCILSMMQEVCFGADTKISHAMIVQHHGAQIATTAMADNLGK